MICTAWVALLKSQQQRQQRWMLMTTCLLFVSTAFAGAALFKAIEYDNEVETALANAQTLSDKRLALGLAPICKDCKTLGMGGRPALPPAAPLPPDSAGCNATLLAELEEEYQSRIKTIKQAAPSLDNIKWTFSGSLFYVLTVMTTVGYGTFVPVTQGGRVATILFGFWSIFVSSFCIGAFVAYLDAYMDQLLSTMWEGCSPRVAIKCKALCTGLLFVLHGSGLAIFAALLPHNRWDAIDALYYSFVTLSTVGLGDLSVSSNSVGSVVSQFALILPGLVLFTQLMNLSIAFSRSVIAGELGSLATISARVSDQVTDRVANASGHVAKGAARTREGVRSTIRRRSLRRQCPARRGQVADESTARTPVVEMIEGTLEERGRVHGKEGAMGGAGTRE